MLRKLSLELDTIKLEYGGIADERIQRSRYLTLGVFHCYLRLLLNVG
jgi:hypothetical protein